MEDPAYWTRLACRITQGDREAEADLARWFHPRIRVIASARLHGSDAALDVAQDTIVAVIEALRAGRVREPERLPAFVLGIAGNLINTRHRTSTLHREVQQDPPEEPASDDSAVVRLDFEQRRAKVRAALVHLNALDRRILILTMVDGLKPREIARQVGLTPEVVRTRKARAVRVITEAVNARDTKPGTPLHKVKALGSAGSEEPA
jgi:RNA polymerase sigma-70 factor (ECF subfamily)